MPAARTALLRLGAAAALLASAAATIGCGPPTAAGARAPGVIAAVGAESEYANVIEQVGGAYVQVTAIESNPSTDPHAYEASPSVAAAVAEAQLVVQNGAGYDAFMEKIESASASSSRRVLDVQKLLGLPAATPNPHLWYEPAAMAALARALARELAALAPAHAAYFQARARAFERSLRPWRSALARFRASHPRAAVASTEPVADYMLEAAGIRNLTPFGMQADVMNGTDPAPQDVALQEQLIRDHRVGAFLHNVQVTSSLTESFVRLARRSGVPVVGVYETMPAGYDYQSWMLAELRAIEAAVDSGASTERL